MNDLFVYTADTDTLAVMKQVLQRHQSLNIHPINFEVDRYSGRDSGMVTHGPNLLKINPKINNFNFLLILWDHHGSGKEKMDPAAVENEVMTRLGNKWQGKNLAVAIVPELEEWIWKHCSFKNDMPELTIGLPSLTRMRHTYS